MQKDLWRIEDVTAGLSANKSNYKVIIESIKNPGKLNITQTFRTASGNTVGSKVGKLAYFSHCFHLLF